MDADTPFEYKRHSHKRSHGQLEQPYRNLSNRPTSPRAGSQHPPASSPPAFHPFFLPPVRSASRLQQRYPWAADEMDRGRLQHDMEVIDLTDDHTPIHARPLPHRDAAAMPPQPSARATRPPRNPHPIIDLSSDTTPSRSSSGYGHNQNAATDSPDVQFLHEQPREGRGWTPPPQPPQPANIDLTQSDDEDADDDFEILDANIFRDHDGVADRNITPRFDYRRPMGDYILRIDGILTPDGDGGGGNHLHHGNYGIYDGGGIHQQRLPGFHQRRHFHHFHPAGQQQQQPAPLHPTRGSRRVGARGGGGETAAGNTRGATARRVRHSDGLPDLLMLGGFVQPQLDFGEAAFDLGLQQDEPYVPPVAEQYSPPTAAPAGFTRSPQEDEVLVCPNCGDELCVGKIDVKRQVWIVKGCGHVYCGECTQLRSKSKRKGKDAKNITSQPFQKCVVEGCGRKCSSKQHMVQLFL